jgi:hypothetical protein
MQTTPAFCTASAQARAFEREVHGLLAEHVLLLRRRCEDQVRMRVRARTDDRRADRGVAHGGIDIGDLRAVLRSERRRGLAVHIDDILEAHARLPREIGRVNLANAPCSEYRHVNRHSRLSPWILLR